MKSQQFAGVKFRRDGYCEEALRSLHTLVCAGADLFKDPSFEFLHDSLYSTSFHPLLILHNPTHHNRSLHHTALQHV
jgi:hypothetical protein